LEDAARAWTLAPKSSATLQTAAALLAYGLVEDSGSGDGRKLKVSDLGWKALEDERPGAKEAALAEAALKPKLIAELADHWRYGRPDDPICLSELKFERGFTDESAKAFLRVFDEAIQFARRENRDKVPEATAAKGIKTPDTGNRTIGDDQPTTTAKVGDFVQWTSDGMDRLLVPTKVVWVSEDRAWLRVQGSDTGIPMSEVHVVPELAADARAASVEAAPSPTAPSNDIKVLFDGTRLRINAYVDRKGLKRLQKIIEANAALLEPDEDEQGT